MRSICSVVASIYISYLALFSVLGASQALTIAGVTKHETRAIDLMVKQLY